MLIGGTNKNQPTSSPNGDAKSVSLDAHETKSFSFLKRTHFRKITNWSFGHLNQNQVLFSDKFKSAKIKTFLTRSKNPIKIKDSEFYKQVTIKLYGKGAKIRDEVLLFGKEIKTKSQFLVKEGQFIFSRIDARNGAFAIVTAEIDGAIVTNDFPVYDIDRNLIDPNYFALFISTKQFADYFQGLSSGTTNRQRMNEADFLEMEIPLPPVKSKDSSAVTQEKLVADYNAEISQADEFEAKAKALEQESETYLLKELGIKIEQTEKKSWKGFKFLQPASLKELSRWDFPFLMDSFEMESQFPVKKLGEFIEYFLKDENNNSLRFESSKFPKTEFNYLGMENVEKTTGEITNFSVLNGSEVKSQTLKVPKDFIIYGKLRPYLNKYWYNDTNLTNVICSSEFFAFKLKQNIDLHFFLILLSSSFVQKQISNQTSGVRMPRMSEDLFFNLEVPIPNDKKIQNKIVKHINNLKAQIKNLKDDARDLRGKAKADFEAELFEM